MGAPSSGLVITAEMDVVVQREGVFLFTGSGADEVELALDDRTVRSGTAPAEWAEFERLAPGRYKMRLQLRVLAGTGDSFERSPLVPATLGVPSEILQWSELSCPGPRSVAPAGRYFWFDSEGAELDQIAGRFGVAPESIIGGGVSAGPVLVPGDAGRSNPKLVLLQGLDSSADDKITSHPLDLDYRRNLILAHLNSRPEAARVRFDEEDVIGFSYGGQYVETRSAKSREADSIEVGDWTAPVHSREDTCSGVAEASERLDRLVKSTVLREPDAVVHLLGHSLGGLVAAYWVSKQPSSFLGDHVGSVITLDSPLFDGHPLYNPFSSCPTDSPSWRDINGSSGVVAAINDYSRTTGRVPFFHINSSAIGDVLPGATLLPNGCGFPEQQLLSQLLDHECLWSEPQTYSQVADVLFASHD